MLRKLELLPLVLPVALFVGCEGTTQNDPAASTEAALESCFSTSSDGSTKCALQGGGFSRDPQDVDHDGRPDAFVCAHLVKVPHGWNGAGGASGAPASSDTAGTRPPLPAVPADADCDRMGCQDMRPHHGAPGAGAGGANGKPAPASGPTTPPAADTASTSTPAGDDDMSCPGHGAQDPGQGPTGHQGGDGAGGAGAPAGHGPGDHGAGGAGGR